MSIVVKKGKCYAMGHENLNPARPQVQGLIFNIQRFSIHDGPGIRTTVFMKGCPLQCPWCSNPESQDPFPNLMARDINCRHCGACVAACSKGAIRVTAAAGRTLDRERCDQCLQCVAACIYGSLQVCGEYVTVERVLDEVLRDRHFYEESGGGVTVSGGEPLTQIDFTARLLQSCRAAGLHTVLDTSGYASWEIFEQALPFLDLVLFDVKHLDAAEHRRATGVDNALILDNLSRLSCQVPIWLRIPLIPGYNDSEAQVKGIIELAHNHGIEKISLLPYHEGGLTKSTQLGKSYRLTKVQTPVAGYVQRLANIVESAGLRVSVSS